MANNNNGIDGTVNSLLKGMENYITTKTIVGEAIDINGTIILPLAEVSFGVGAGAFASDKKDNCAGGMGGKVTPSAVLVIQNGSSKLVSVKNSDVFSKILDLVPDLINKFSDKGDDTIDFAEMERDED